MKRHLNIKEKIFCTIIVMVLIYICIISAIDNIILENAITENMEQYAVKYLEDFDARVEEKNQYLFSSIYANINSVGLNEEDVLFSMMSEYQENSSIQRELVNKCTEIINSSAYISAMGIMTADNSYIYIQSREGTSEEELMITEALEEGNANDNKYNNRILSGNEEKFIVVKPIIDINTMKYLGVSVFVIDQKYYMELVQYSMLVNNWHVVFTDENDNPFYASDADVLEQYNTMIDELDGEDIVGIQNIGTVSYVINERQSINWQMNIILLMDAKVVSEATNQHTILIILVAILSIIIAIFVTYYISSKLSRDTQYVASVVKEISQGDLNKKIELDSGDEIAIIANEINVMTSSIQKLINEAYITKISEERAQREAVEFEYAALCAKMNPHFLYNVLEGINSMAKINKEEGISEVSCLLAEILHDTLDGERSIVYLEDEVEHVNKYIKLKKLLRKNQFKYICNIDEILLGAKLPRFTIQPLIENAFKHGIDRISEEGVIVLTCELRSGNIIIEVKDNGAGKIYNRYIEIDENKSWKNTKIGIESIDKRIKLLYGENYGITLCCGDGETTARVNIPYITEGEA